MTLMEENKLLTPVKLGYTTEITMLTTRVDFFQLFKIPIQMEKFNISLLIAFLKIRFADFNVVDVTYEDADAVFYTRSFFGISIVYRWPFFLSEEENCSVQLPVLQNISNRGQRYQFHNPMVSTNRLHWFFRRGLGLESFVALGLRKR